MAMSGLFFPMDPEGFFVDADGVEGDVIEPYMLESLAG